MLQSHRELTKKLVSKKMFFDEDMNFWKCCIFDGPKNAKTDVRSNYRGVTSLAEKVEIRPFLQVPPNHLNWLKSKSIQSLEILVGPISMQKRSLNPKNGFQELKIISTSGMTSLTRNLGQFGDVLKFAWDFRGTNMVKYRVGVFSLEKTRGIQ